MRFSAALVALVGAAPMIAHAGYIQCQNGQVAGGSGNIPSHNVIFDIGGTSGIGPAIAENCAQMIGGVRDKTEWFSSISGGGQGVNAQFWITSNGCMNIQYNGEHHFCCPGKINNGLHSATVCEAS